MTVLIHIQNYYNWFAASIILLPSNKKLHLCVVNTQCIFVCFIFRHSDVIMFKREHRLSEAGFVSLSLFLSFSPSSTLGMCVCVRVCVYWHAVGRKRTNDQWFKHNRLPKHRAHYCCFIYEAKALKYANAAWRCIKNHAMWSDGIDFRTRFSLLPLPPFSSFTIFADCLRCDISQMIHARVTLFRFYCFL